MGQKSFNLSNGLILEIKDESKKIAADRWVVRCRAVMDIPLKYIDDDEIKAEFGENIKYDKLRERNFVDDDDKDMVFDELSDSFTEISLKYLSDPGFPKKYILKKYDDHKQQKSKVIPMFKS